MIASKTNGKCVSQPRTPRIFAYCHDGVGLGHLRRTLNICEHVGHTFSRASFLIATGNLYVSLFDRQPCIEYLKLPSLRKVNNDCYLPRFLDLAPSEILQCRETLIRESVRQFAPHIVLIDKAPVGVCGELIGTLRWLRRNLPKTRIVFGMRDIEDEAEVTVSQWRKLGAQTMLEDFFDEIWVYGMRDVFDVVSQYRLSKTIQSKLRFMGYIARTPCRHDHLSLDTASGGCSGSPKRQVLVTVGGGTDGTKVLETYLDAAAARVAKVPATSLIVAGPDFPKEAALKLRKRAEALEEVEWLDFASCMSCRIRSADLVVCMGGYNTLCEVVSNGKPALVLPRVQPRLEQAIRAHHWAEKDLVEVLPHEEIQPERLAERVVGLLQRRSKSIACDLDFSGLDRVSRRFLVLLNGGVPHETAVSL